MKRQTKASAKPKRGAPQQSATPPTASGNAFPALRGVQAGREYFVLMVPVRHVHELLPPVDPRVAPETRAQRVLNMPRVHKLVAYLTGNPRDYTLPPLVGLVDGLPTFEPKGGGIGMLQIPHGMKLATLDGQHRRAALQMATRERPALRDETIPVVLFVDVGLELAQQRFSDLNGHAVRPPRSLSLLFDHRSELSALSRAVARRVRGLGELVDGERASIAGRSPKLFPFAALHAATKALLAGRGLSPEGAEATAVKFWEAVLAALPALRAPDAKALREQSVLAHGVTLEALGRVGNAILALPDAQQSAALEKLGRLDFKREAPTWTGRAVVNGRMMKNRASVVLTANAIKRAIGIDLTPEEREHEARLAR